MIHLLNTDIDQTYASYETNAVLLKQITINSPHFD